MERRVSGPSLPVLLVLLCIAIPVYLAAFQRDSSETFATRRISAPAFGTLGPSSIRMDVRLVLVPVLVTDPLDRPVLGLHKSDFRLFDDGVEQEITYFFEDQNPISVGILFDASSSMVRRMDASRSAMSAFLERTLPDDEFQLIRFSDRPEEMQPFTTDIRSIEAAIAGIQAKGWTALYDAIRLGLHSMHRASRTKKVLLILSDGSDNNSRYNEREVVSAVRESDVRIFAISIFERSATLERLAEESGGRAYRVRKVEELPELMSMISDELHSRYVLGYAPVDPRRDGKYRKVKVELAGKPDGPRLRASWRRGYYGPME